MLFIIKYNILEHWILWKKIEEIDCTLLYIQKEKTKMKNNYLKVEKPNRALLIKVEKEAKTDDIINQVKNSRII